MAKIKHGTITISIPDELAPPEKAGKMSADEVARIPKAQLGVGLICAQAADIMEKVGPSFTAPAGVTPESLRAAAKRADEIDQYLVDIDVVREILKQANLLFDAEAWEQVRKVNDQVKAQGKHDPSLATSFKQVIDYFAKGPRAPKAGKEPPK